MWCLTGKGETQRACCRASDSAVSRNLSACTGNVWWHLEVCGHPSTSAVTSASTIPRCPEDFLVSPLSCFQLCGFAFLFLSGAFSVRLGRSPRSLRSRAPEAPLLRALGESLGGKRLHGFEGDISRKSFCPSEIAKITTTVITVLNKMRNNNSIAFKEEASGHATQRRKMRRPGLGHLGQKKSPTKMYY